MSSVIRTLVFIIPISYGCSSEKDFAGGTNSRIASKSEQQEDADSNDIDNIDDLNLACSRSVKSTKKLILKIMNKFWETFKLIIQCKNQMNYNMTNSILNRICLYVSSKWYWSL